MSISAIDFAHDLGEGCPFGTAKEETSATLRLLADKIDSDDIILQSARVTGISRVDDYTLTGVRLVFVEKKK